MIGIHRRMVDFESIFFSHTGKFVVERVRNRFEERVSHNCLIFSLIDPIIRNDHLCVLVFFFFFQIFFVEKTGCFFLLQNTEY